MHKRVWLALLLGLLLANFGRTSGGVDDPTKKEPVYKGKNLSEWIKGLKGTDPKAREQAIEALSVLGPKAKTAVPARRTH